MAMFTREQIQAIADALGDTDEGLAGSEIGDLLASIRVNDPSATLAKRHRLFNAFVERQNNDQNRTEILAFIRKAMKPERFLRDSYRYEPLRTRLNGALSFVGLAVKADGNLETAESASTLTEAQRRADELRADLVTRRVHPDVLLFCKAELIADDYFHAVLEAAKSAADKLRARTGVDRDGSELVDFVLLGKTPLLIVNPYNTTTEQSEQKGFAMLIKGVFSMFRNPTAHEPRIHRTVTRDEAEDFLTIVSQIHRRLDAAVMPPRTP
ncbi:TIGR02391 family protein [Pinisolibacter aquiterrae]|uniref:TIGR02391 family protein n=1 Tax=Pinisolibacter aquiterrae TaxID=2815579 RepID=UPI001C3E3368|nr:TIGR02391 family protein [Pinisolibacter aquiterrae]MBV5266052.1 TIGR02391 family protein [Pinisolibacter aquiterrae]MCC8233655.1 TIGR02391 family protein [Pinisolibacter aquiterrae]